jgi:spore germination protein KC
MSAKGVSAVLPVVKQTQNNGQVVPEISGTAVFKKDRMIGYLNGNDTKTFLFITNQIKGGLLTHKEYLGSSHSNIALEIFNNKTKAKPMIINGKLIIKISTQTNVALGENAGTANFLDKKGMAKIKNDFEKQLENNIKNLIRKVQNNYDSDIFGFGKKVKVTMPKLWKKIESKWDKDFKSIDISVSSEINIENSALESKSLKAGD